MLAARPTRTRKPGVPRRACRSAGLFCGYWPLHGGDSDAWAATVRYADEPNQLPPWNTLARLSRHDIVIHVTRSWEPSPPKWILLLAPEASAARQPTRAQTLAGIR